MPEITLSLPAALGLLSLFLSIGAGMVFFALRETGMVVEPTITPTITLTMTETVTSTPETPTPTEPPLPTPTPLSYTVKAGETCSDIAFSFSVSINSIVLLNNLSTDCNIFEGQSLVIPQPTPTSTPLPTSTLNPAEETEQACEKVVYTVQPNDTLGGIANNYGVPMSVIREYNGLPSDIVYEGLPLTIPLCLRNPTPGPTPTATPPPPYPAPNPLLPIDGATLSDISVTLQWASVGTLNDNEAYAVTVVDFTDGEERKQVDYVTDTKYIVPSALRPTGNQTHLFRWWVMTVRQIGVDGDGNSRWEPAGAASKQRVFSWTGGPPVSAATPAPP